MVEPKRDPKNVRTDYLWSKNKENVRVQGGGSAGGGEMCGGMLMTSPKNSLSFITLMAR